jgi:hypothetical protein
MEKGGAQVIATEKTQAQCTTGELHGWLQGEPNVAIVGRKEDRCGRLRRVDVKLVSRNHTGKGQGGLLGASWSLEEVGNLVTVSFPIWLVGL